VKDAGEYRLLGSRFEVDWFCRVDGDWEIELCLETDETHKKAGNRNETITTHGSATTSLLRTTVRANHVTVVLSQSRSTQVLSSPLEALAG
jgi:hypothetical protein